MCKQHHRTALNPLLNGTKNGADDGMCKRILNIKTRKKMSYIASKNIDLPELNLV